MVDLSNGVIGMLPKVSASSLINGVMIFCIIVIVGGLLAWLVIYWFKNKKYKEYNVTIWEKDSTGNTHERYTKGGVFVDKKTNLKLLFIKGINKGMDPNNIPYVVSTDKKGKLIKKVYLRKIGVSSYVFVRVKINDDGVVLKVGEEDVNWVVNDTLKVRQSFLKEGFLQKFAPYILFIISILITMIILISLFNKMGVIKDAAANLEKVAELNLQTTQLLYNLTNQTDRFQQTIPVIQVGGIK